MRSRLTRRNALRTSTIVAALVLLAFTNAPALNPGDLSRVTFEQHPGVQIARDLVFRDENGRAFRFGDHFGKEPIILVLGYYRCPMLCMLINDGLIQALQDLKLQIGRDFQVVDVSIDPDEKPADALAKKAQYMKSYGRPEAAANWHCLVGDRQSIARLTDQVGFRYGYDPQTRQYAHPSGVITLTPEGKISRYVFGVKFDPKDIRDAIVSAKQEQSSSIISQVILLCYHYNPITGKYGASILTILRVGGVITLLGIVGFIVMMVRREKGEPQGIT
jgi:protein SCO1/2